MNKLILTLLITIISFQTKAHHLVPLGWCSINGKAVFVTSGFANNLNVEVQYQPYGSNTWFTGPTFNTASTGNTDKIFSVPQPIQNQPVKVRFRYKPINSQSFNSWSTSYTEVTSLYGNCTVLPIHFKTFNIKLKKS